MRIGSTFLSRTAGVAVIGIIGIACVTAFRPTAASAQAADAQTLQTIAAEIQELRLAFERSNMITARLQLAFQRAQAQERRVDTLSREFDEARRQLSGDQMQHQRFIEEMTDLQNRIHQTPEGPARRQLEDQLKGMKSHLQMGGEQMRLRQEREIELRTAVQNEQARLKEFNERLSALERIVDGR